ncbi:hypothetical protein [Escherichia coli]|uniref:hypothetical protein n=1 Tax=Escherichia coli TaxID=562 RepID=UPI0039B6F105
MNYDEITKITAKRISDYMTEAVNTDSIAVAYFHERRSLNNFHRDRVITFEQIAE